MNSQIQSQNIGPNTTIWQFVVVLPKAQIGADCNICSHCFIENDVIIGDRVTIKNGVSLYDGMRIEDDVFIGPNATFTNDKFPRSKRYPGTFPMTIVRTGASIGGGGNHTSRNNDWDAGDGRRGSRGYPIGAGSGNCDGQPGAGGWFRGGWQ